MISLEKCKEILEKEGNKYTLEQTKIIREFLLEIIEIQGLNLYSDYDEKSSINGSGFE